MLPLVVQIKGRTHVALMLAGCKKTKLLFQVAFQMQREKEVFFKTSLILSLRGWLTGFLVSKASSSNVHMATSTGVTLLTLSPFHSLLYRCRDIRTHSVMRTHRHIEWSTQRSGPGAPEYIQKMSLHIFTWCFWKKIQKFAWTGWNICYVLNVKK